MNWLTNFMRGRYGVDPFAVALIALGMVCTLVGSITGTILLSFLSYAFFLYCLFRMFSKNIDKRRKENAMFMKVWGPIVKNIKQMQQTSADRKTHRYFTCPSCKQRVRVPKAAKKRKLRIICPT
ncbi:MAG: hypothetical protein RR977_04860, partial [Oscillospiraceae bacterium]